MRPLTDEETKKFFMKLSEYIGANIKFLLDRSDEPYVFRLIKDRVYYMSEQLMKLSSNVSKDQLIQVGTCFGKFTKSGKFRLHITSLDYLAKYAKHKIWIKPTGEQSYLYGNHVMKAHIGNFKQLVEIIFIGPKFIQSKQFEFSQVNKNLYSSDSVEISCILIIINDVKYNLHICNFYNFIQQYNQIGRMTENIPKYAGVVYFSMNDTCLGFGIASRSTVECKDLEPTAIIGFNQSDLGEYLRVEDESKNN